MIHYYSFVSSVSSSAPAAVEQQPDQLRLLLAGPPPLGRDLALSGLLGKDWVELFIRNEQILSPDSENSRNFHMFLQFFCNSQRILTFSHTLWNSEKISSTFRSKIAVVMSKLRKFEWIGCSFFQILPKLWLFCWIFEIWAVQKYVNLVDLEKCCRMRLLSLS